MVGAPVAEAAGFPAAAVFFAGAFFVAAFPAAAVVVPAAVFFPVAVAVFFALAFFVACLPAAASTGAFPAVALFAADLVDAVLVTAVFLTTMPRPLHTL
ncbi:hypothetical protein [Streptomyces sp. TRM64462]|uniref:hypothetical protein n=1 Tax=Streptomyces sp. TRM64462 TaxID=2741726 RepID=UPI002815D2BD|nr:hypothetical protein [Streptomyces sp. TRM64462]